MLIPVKPEFLAAIGIPLLIRSISEFKLQYDNHALEIAGLVFNDADPQHTKKEHNQGRNDVHALATNRGGMSFRMRFAIPIRFPPVHAMGSEYSSLTMRDGG